MKFILLIKVKIPTNVDILTFMSMINTIYENFKARKMLNFSVISFYEKLEFNAQLS